MKNLLFLLIAFLTTITIKTNAQNYVIQENFETLPISLTSSTIGASGTGVWAINNRVSSQGVKSDSCTVTLGDTTWLTTNAFSTLGKYSVILEFDQICKTNFWDKANVQYSSDSGVTFQNIPGGYYLGSGGYSTNNNSFNSYSYPSWAGQDTTLVNDTMWKREIFDLSAITANTANVVLRFQLMDKGNYGANGSEGYPGWFIDSLTVIATFSELVPPTITLADTIFEDTAFVAGPYKIKAHIFDLSGIDTAYCIYSIYPENIIDTLAMTMDTATTDTFSCVVPFFGYGRTITYQITAIDDSPAHNTTTNDSTTFYCKYSPGGTYIIGTSTASSTSYGPVYAYSATSTTDFARYSYLFKNTELSAEGAPSSGEITRLEWFKTNNSATTGNAKFKIYAKNTTSSILVTNSWSSIISGATQVYNSTTQTLPAVAGWVPFNITPFAYSGQNIQISTDWDISAVTGNAQTGALNWKYNALLTGRALSGTGWAAPAVTLYTTYQGRRPLLRITFVTPNILNNEIGVVSIENPNSGILAGTDESVEVKVKNFGIDTITSFNIKYSLNGVLEDSISITNTTLYPDSTITVIIDTINLNIGSYVINTWTELPNGNDDFNIDNDSLDFYFYACSSLLNGTYTVGTPTSDYASIADAALALNQCGIDGPVTFNIASGTYNEQIKIGMINGSSPTNTITFQSASGDSSDVVLSYYGSTNQDNFILTLDETSYISFKKMSFVATGTNKSRVIVLKNNPSNFSFTNCVFEATTPFYGTSADKYRDIVAGTDSIGDNVEFRYNRFTNGNAGLSLKGGIAKQTGWNITNNIFTRNASGSILISNANSCIVNDNLINNDTVRINFYHAINIDNCKDSIEVLRNQIYLIGTATCHSVSITSCIGSTSKYILFANNFVHLKQISATHWGVGFQANNSKNINVYYNNILLSGSHANSSALQMYNISNASSANLNLKNNIFANIISGGSIFRFINCPNTVYTNDYNDLYNGGVGKISGTITTLSAWQAASSDGAHSIVENPYFISDIDLHIINNIMNGTGSPIAGITTDIDGDVRDTLTPDIGADEFDPSPWDIATLEVLSPFGGCGLSSSEVVSIRIQNIGSNAINGNLTVHYSWPGGNPVSENITTALDPGDTLDYTFTTTADFDINYYGKDSIFALVAWAELLNDPIPYNDSAYKEIISSYQPVAPITTPATANYGIGTTITATSNDSLYWFSTDTSITEIEATNNYFTGPLYDTTIFYVEAHAGAPAIKITETIQYSSGLGHTNPYPSYFPTGDFDGVELTNLGTGIANIEGYTINVVFNSNVHSYTFPSNTIILSGEVLNALYKLGVTIGPAGNNIYYIDNSSGISSNSSVAYWLTDNMGNVVDAFASNNASFPANSGVVASDFTGSFPNGTGKAGAMRIVSDNNAASDWILAGTGTAATFGSKNPQLEISGGIACASPRVPLQVNVIGFPSEDAGIRNIVNPTPQVIAGTDQPIKFELISYGISTLTSVDVVWELNGVMQDTFNYVGSLLYQQKDTITLDTMQFAAGVYDIKAWTINPNNVPDTINTNDTAFATFHSSMIGTYTIGVGTQFDYQDFTSAANALNTGGIIGDVIFLVDTGTYEENFVIEDIFGTNPNATIKFIAASGDSSQTIIHFNTSAFTAAVVKNKSDFVTFENMTISSFGGSNYGHAIELASGASNFNLKNCIIKGVDLGTNASTSANYAVVHSDNSHHNNISFENNDIWFGSSAIYLNSNSSHGLNIENNRLYDFTYYGIYAKKHDSLVIYNNIITSSFNGTSKYGISVITSNVLNIQKNRIKIFPGGSYGSGVGIALSTCISNSAARGLVANNFVYFGSGNSTNRGIALSSVANNDIIYNTVRNIYGNLNNKAIDVTSYGGQYVGVNIINNILRDSLGYAICIGNSSNISNMDYNMYYTTSTNFAKWNTNKADLAALQTASSMDPHSLTIDPIFVSNDSVSLASAQLSSYGTPHPRVLDDIDGEIRGVNVTTPGADEVALLPIDVGVLSILNIPSNTNEAQNISPSAVVSNFGTSSISNFDIDYQINNGSTVSFTYTSTLLPGANDTVALTAFASPAGNSSFCVTTVLATDSNNFNDSKCQNFFGLPSKDAQVVKIFGLNKGCALSSDTIRILIKNLGQDTINGPGGSTPTVNFVSDLGVGATVVTENMTSVIYPGASVVYQFSALANLTNNTQLDSLFTVTAWIDYSGDNVAYNDTAYYYINSPHTPAVPSFTSPISASYGTTINLLATPTPNDSVYWFDSNTATNELSVGRYHNSGFLYADKTLYLESHSVEESPIVISEVKLGADHIEIQNRSISEFNATGWKVAISQSVSNINTRNSDIWSLGTFAPNSAQWRGNVSGTNNWGSYIQWGIGDNGWAILIDNTGKVRDFVAWGWSISDINSMSLSIPPYTNVNPNFPDVNWYGDGKSANCSQTIYRIDKVSNDSNDFICRVHDKGVPNVFLNAKNTLGMECISPRVPMVINVNAQSNDDIGILRIESPKSGLFHTENDTVIVTVKNFGINSQSNIPVSYSFGANNNASEIINSTIASGDTLAYTFTNTADLSVIGNAYHLTAYSALSNDGNRLNDTLKSVVVNEFPSYCISRANYSSTSEIVNVSIGSLFSNNSPASGAMYTNFMPNVMPAFVQIGALSSIALTSDFAPGATYNSNGWIKIFIDYNRDGDFDDANEEVYSSATTASNTVTGSFTVPASVQSGSTAMRVVLRMYGSTSNTLPCGTYSNGETEDYLINIAPRINFDAGVEKILSPEIISYTETPNLIVRVRNYGLSNMSNFNIKYRINNGPVNTYFYNSGNVPPLDTAIINMGQISIPQGTSNITVYTELTDDSVNVNDTMHSMTFVQAYENLTYVDDFEGNNKWLNDTLLNQWERGTPSATHINTAHSGVNAWAINLAGNYANHSDDRLYSPVFIVPSNVDSAFIKFWHYMDCEGSDGGYLQFKAGKNGNWLPVGYAGIADGTNWYNANNGGTYMWTQINSGWMQSKFVMKFNDFMNPFYNVGDTLQFRFIFYSNANGNDKDGWAIDDFEVSLPVIPNDVGVTAFFTPTDTVQAGSSINVKVDIKNFGSSNQTSIPVSFNVNNSATPISATFTPAGSGLAPGATQQFTFPTAFTAPGTDFSICAQTNLPNDIYTLNDKSCKNVATTAADLDVGIVSFIITPNIDGDTTNQVHNSICIVKIVNFGVLTQSSIPVEYTINGNIKGNETWTGALASGDTATYTFSTVYHCPLGNYTVCAKSNLANDANTANDEVCRVFVGIYDPNGIDDADDFSFSVNQNEPNPAVGIVNISFVTPKVGEVKFELRNALGQIIKSSDNKYNAGNNALTIDASLLANGVYYYTLEFDGKRITHKMIVSE